MGKNRKGQGDLSAVSGEDGLSELGAAEQAERDLGWDDGDGAEEDAVTQPSPNLPEEEYLTVAAPYNVYAFAMEFIVVIVDVFDGETGEWVPTATLRTMDGDFVTHFDPRKPEEERMAFILQAEAIERSLAGHDDDEAG